MTDPTAKTDGLAGASQTAESPPTTSGNQVRGWIGMIVATTFSRVVLNTARRFAYTFAPVMSRGLGVPLYAVTSLIAINQATSVLGMFSGPIADRIGYRLMMLAGLGMLVGGMFAGGLVPLYGVVLISLVLAGLGKTIFDPALQGYVGRRIPFHRRGLVIGILETSWAGSTLVGIPLISLLIEAIGWRAPFFALSGAGLIGLLALRLVLARDEAAAAVRHNFIGFWATWRKLVVRRPALGALGFGFLISAGNDNLFVVYGAWLEKSFDLGVVALGVGTSVIGAAELTGEFLTAAFGDRIGLARSVFMGMAAALLAYLALPLWDRSLTTALTGLFIIFLTFEFTMVTFLSLCTELMPDARATMMAGFLAASGLGRVVGAFAGGPVWLVGGVALSGLVSAALTLLALASLIWGLKGWRR